MLGYETRGTAIGKGNSVRPWRLEHCHARYVRRDARASAARSAETASRSRMRRAAAGVRSMVVMILAMLMGMSLGGSATMLPFAQRHQHTGVAAQRQGCEQQGQ